MVILSITLCHLTHNSPLNLSRSVIFLQVAQYPATGLPFRARSLRSPGHSLAMPRARHLLLRPTSNSPVGPLSPLISMASPTPLVNFQSMSIQTTRRVSTRFLVAITAMLSTLKLNHSFLELAWVLHNHSLQCLTIWAVLMAVRKLGPRTWLILRTLTTDHLSLIWEDLAME